MYGFEGEAGNNGAAGHRRGIDPKQADRTFSNFLTQLINSTVWQRVAEQLSRNRAEVNLRLDSRDTRQARNGLADGLQTATRWGLVH